ncbi:hypothetical protein F4804DRAFT_308756 [Jackrogersella minutella]|nr:hypothetical protein F4804DRAFT_308756 [Jackrogersella minutella]
MRKRTFYPTVKSCLLLCTAAAAAAACCYANVCREFNVDDGLLASHVISYSVKEGGGENPKESLIQRSFRTCM